MYSNFRRFASSENSNESSNDERPAAWKSVIIATLASSGNCWQFYSSGYYSIDALQPRPPPLHPSVSLDYRISASGIPHTDHLTDTDYRQRARLKLDLLGAVFPTCPLTRCEILLSLPTPLPSSRMLRPRSFSEHSSSRYVTLEKSDRESSGRAVVVVRAGACRFRVRSLRALDLRACVRQTYSLGENGKHPRRRAECRASPRTCRQIYNGDVCACVCHVILVVHTRTRTRYTFGLHRAPTECA